MKTLRILKNNTAILRSLVLFLFGSVLIFALLEEPVTGFPQNRAEHRIALSIDDSDDSSLTSEQLEKIKQIGIDLLEIPFPTSLSPSVLDQFYLLLDSNLHFTTEYELETNHESILNLLRSNYNGVPDQLKDNLAAIKVFDFPADYRPSFSASSDSLLSELFDYFEKPLYYQSAFSTPEFPLQNVDFFVSKITAQPGSLRSTLPPILFFEPSNNPIASLQTLETILNQALDTPGSLIVIPADWFIERTEAQESFSIIITSYLQGEPINFPMPASTSGSSESNWAIILLLLIWASFILHYRNQPMYKTALPRYFFYHSFFVHDVMQQRMRSASPGIVVLFQHAIITGFLAFLVADSFISDTGLEVLSYHYPFLFYPGFELMSIFILGIIIALISHIISIAWLYLPNKKLKQLNQVINLYSWPFHINLVIATIAVYFIQIKSAQDWTIAILLIYFFFWFSGFIIAAIDSARFLDKFRALNLFLTVGLYFLMTITLLVIFFLVSGINQPLEMAFMFP